MKWECQGVKFFFFPDSHLAPKSFKVDLDRPFKIKSGKRSLSYYNVDTRMDGIQRSSSPQFKMASSYRSRCLCCVLETNLTRKFAADLSLLIFLILYISK